MEDDAKTRWKEISMFSDPINISNVILFGGKTPYKSELPLCLLVYYINERVSETTRVKLTIDLTNSNKYYTEQAQLNECKECKYIKIACGGDSVPTSLQVDHVTSIIDSYVNHSKTGAPEVAIFIHCTHGCNRTGFMIVSLLMRYGIYTDVDAAIKYFLNMRDKDCIMKDDYSNALRSIYKTILPHEINTSSVNLINVHHDLQTRLIPKMQMLQGKVSSEDAFLGPMPKTLTKSNLSDISKNLKNYFVTPKADGVRYLVLIDRTGIYALGRDQQIQRVCIKIGQHQEDVHLLGCSNTYLFDCELIEKLGTGRSVLLAFDILHTSLGSLLKHMFVVRYGMLHITLNDLIKEKVILPISAKPFYPLHLTVAHENPTYRTDGYIFYHAKHYYSAVSDVYKWKDVETVDFSVDINLNLSIRKDGQVVIVDTLYSKDKDTVLQLFRVAPPETEVVIECKMEEEDGNNINWRLVRHRHDRKVANAWSTYKHIINNRMNRIKHADLPIVGLKDVYMQIEQC